MLIMVLSQADKHVIEAVFKEKGWRVARIIKEFPSKNWCKSSVNRLIKKVEQTGSIARKKGSGRPTTVCTEENAALVDELLCSQDDQPGTHLSQRKIAQRLNIERKSVRNIIKYKLNKKAFKRLRASRKTPAVREKKERLGHVRHWTVTVPLTSKESCLLTKRTFKLRLLAILRMM